MIISDAISILSRLKEKYGDVEVVTDCEKCGHVTTPNTIAPGKPVVKLSVTP